MISSIRLRSIKLTPIWRCILGLLSQVQQRSVFQAFLSIWCHTLSSKPQGIYYGLLILSYTHKYLDENYLEQQWWQGTKNNQHQRECKITFTHNVTLTKTHFQIPMTLGFGANLSLVMWFFHSTKSHCMLRVSHAFHPNLRFQCCIQSTFYGQLEYISKILLVFLCMLCGFHIFWSLCHLSPLEPHPSQSKCQLVS